MGNTLVSKKLLNIFIEQKKLAGVVSFLLFLREKENLKEFYNFCEKRSQSFKHTEVLDNGILFHGSQEVHSVLNPNISIGEGGKPEEIELVYATDDPNYAIFLATLDLKNGGAGVDATTKGKIVLSINLDFINGDSQLTDGYVHVLQSKSFKEVGNREYTTNETTTVLFTIPVTPLDLTAPICVNIPQKDF